MCDKLPQIYLPKSSIQILSHSFCSSGVLAWFNWVSESCSPPVGWTVFTPGALTGEESTSRLIQVVERIQNYNWLCFLSGCWSRDHLHCLACGPCNFEARQCRWSPSQGAAFHLSSSSSFRNPVFTFSSLG